jgi:uncharacterized protein (TIGR03084 family)
MAAQSLRRNPDRTFYIVSTLVELRNDLVAEQNSLDEIVADLTNAQWHRATPSPGWDVFDQVAHLAYFDERAALAIVSPDQFRRDLGAMVERMSNESIDEITLAPFRALAPDELLVRWREARQSLDTMTATLSDDSRVEWYGPSMGAKSFLTARLMETWAHGVDIVDALEVTREPTDRLHHIAQLGFLTRQWSYAVRGEVAPAGDVRLDLVGPDGKAWRWGSLDADDTVTGSAEEFCLVVTQRRHVDDTALVAGELGTHWLTRAQAFAGAPTTGPQRRSRR